MDLALTEDQRNFQALARAVLDKEVVPHRAAWDRAESVDTAIIPALGEIGFFGLTIPEVYGGLGGGLAQRHDAPLHVWCGHREIARRAVVEKADELIAGRLRHCTPGIRVGNR